ncbi:hypothetical protein DSBG_1813 [Desulfosporosinus sp. BG]|nr:hypothetical protein DSBG_1813 [Desulfosporosinus sp. BG]
MVSRSIINYLAQNKLPESEVINFHVWKNAQLEVACSKSSEFG